MTLQTAGIHHITAFAGDPQANVDFYAGVLGLRLVKKTINFDAPDVYHLYFGNEEGAPGTIITFFPFPGARRGRIGGGQVGFTTYVIPQGALDFWKNRLQSLGISVTEAERFGEQYLQFKDHEGLQLELVERESGAQSAWSFAGIPVDKAIKGFGGAVLYSVNPERTAYALESVLGMEKIGEYAGFARFRATGDLGNLIDLPTSAVPHGAGGAGTVHHIAWRAKDFEEHEMWRGAVSGGGFQPTPVVDRQYFNAVYFREEGGILFEIATDPPGFTVDEAPEALGETLMLPEWYESKRTQIENGLLPITVREPDWKNGK
ncbi:ring-cleaving dioxygenase [Saccharibacillus kuerlensis]|uniref:Ring-cleaving dioxygenase mhqO n=1 Tax=Saccharibacillus kuerlensis TaxID=459527 RepID=A0ABQ2L825_9BACL|nr:ring-cleaving dioxygenase [Saccharibacillus kuerlensis]GGO06069.1 ring-cleaving dioxygenase mhqO [Saccharibacillus kuerlensis]